MKGGGPISAEVIAQTLEDGTVVLFLIWIFLKVVLI
jgi:hypothetical protein